MKIIHFLNEKNKEEKEVDSGSLLLGNNKGDYLWMKERPQSRYEGWFCRLQGKMQRIIESLEVEGAGEVTEIENGFGRFARKRGDLAEIFYLSESSHTFIYELSEDKRVNLYLDVRESYSSCELQDYRFNKEGNFAVLEFGDFGNRLFLVIKGGEVSDIKEAVSRHYLYDEKRNSPPSRKNVYRGLSLYGKRFVFSVAGNKKKAISEADKIFVRSFSGEQEEIDTLCAKKSLSGLLVSQEEGLCAGIPWFFQFWPRDEAISLKSLLSIDLEKGKRIFFRLLESGFTKGPGGVVNRDALGWLFKRADDVLPFLSVAEKEKLRRELKKYVEELLWGFTEDGFAVNRAHETWMDSLGRDGARIELQAMRLNMYRLAVRLSKRGSERKIYEGLEEKMRRKVKSAFFDGRCLADGYYPRNKVLEKTIRPNIFIAAYIYPDLLRKEEWIRCFESALESLWLSWGGLATLEKNSGNFRNEHTGENSESYHQGDSWFYLNNLAATVLYRFDKKRFASYIEKIMEASKEEIMWKGAAGCHGEVSSAKELRSEGCANQAWSSAMYLEAKEEMKRKK